MLLGEQPPKTLIYEGQLLLREMRSSTMGIVSTEHNGRRMEPHIRPKLSPITPVGFHAECIAFGYLDDP